MTRKEIKPMIEKKIKEHGFRKKKSVLLKPINDHMNYWIGLNTAIRNTKDYLYVNPVIGMQHVSLEKLMFQLTDLDSLKHNSTSFSSPLGYLTDKNDFIQWEFHPEYNNEEIADDMIASILKFGLPFIDKCVGYRFVIQKYNERRIGFPEDKYFIIPALLYLNGETEEALAYLENNKDREIQYNISYTEFIKRFKELVENKEK